MASLLKCLFCSIRNFLIIFLAVSLIPGIPPKTHFDIESFTVPKAKPLTGPLAVNKLLDNTEHLYQDRILGAECLISRGNEVYASLNNEIVKITGNHITHVAKFGKPCNAAQGEEVCGRPLGMAFDTITDGIIAADAYHGLYLVDLKTGKVTTLVSAVNQDGKPLARKPKLFNGVAVSQSNGDIFWTDSSSDYDRINGLLAFFANPSGRLFQYDRATGKSKLLLENLYFANGVALSPQEDFVLVAESAALRVMRYHLKGKLAGTVDTFVDGLPGTPDNLTPDADGVWIPLGTIVSTENPALWLSASNAPLVRKFILRIFNLIEMPLQFVQNSFPNAYVKMALDFCGSFESAAVLMPKGTIVVRVDWTGKIVGSLHSYDGSIGHVAHVMQMNDYLWMGSYANKFIGRKKLPAEFQFQSAKVRKVNPTESKPIQQPTTTTPMPTTTTQRPTTTTITPKPATTKAPTTTTTQKPATTKAPTTTTPKPAPKPTQPKTAAPTPPTTTPKPLKPSTPAPIHEELPADTKPPPKEKLRVIKKGGAQEEL